MRALDAPAPCCCPHPPHSVGTQEPPLQGMTDGAAAEEEEEVGDDGDGCAAVAGLQGFFPTGALGIKQIRTSKSCSLI